MDPIFGNNEIDYYRKNRITIHRRLEHFMIGIEQVDLVADVIITHLISEGSLDVMYYGYVEYYDSYFDLHNGKKNGRTTGINRGSIKLIINDVIKSIEEYRDNKNK